MTLAIDFFQVPPPRTTHRRTTFCCGEMVRHEGEDAMVVRFSPSRGVLLKGASGKWFAEPDEIEPRY